jgi:hypothetical protein
MSKGYAASQERLNPANFCQLQIACANYDARILTSVIKLPVLDLRRWLWKDNAHFQMYARTV